jgi:hypothetical protein
VNHSSPASPSLWIKVARAFILRTRKPSPAADLLFPYRNYPLIGSQRFELNEPLQSFIFAFHLDAIRSKHGICGSSKNKCPRSGENKNPARTGQIINERRRQWAERPGFQPLAFRRTRSLSEHSQHLEVSLQVCEVGSHPRFLQHHHRPDSDDPGKQ